MCTILGKGSCVSVQKKKENSVVIRLFSCVKTFFKISTQPADHVRENNPFFGPLNDIPTKQERIMGLLFSLG